MLTATASLVDRVVGLELGADDYLAKPCELRELLARVRSVLRRSAAARAMAHEAPPPRREVRLRTKSGSTSTPRACATRAAVTAMPLSRASSACSRRLRRIPAGCCRASGSLDLASARDSDPFDRAVDVRITRIRRKIEPDPAHPTVIKTVRGAGYIFSPES